MKHVSYNLSTDTKHDKDMDTPTREMSLIKDTGHCTPMLCVSVPVHKCMHVHMCATCVGVHVYKAHKCTMTGINLDHPYIIVQSTLASPTTHLNEYNIYSYKHLLCPRMNWGKSNIRRWNVVSSWTNNFRFKLFNLYFKLTVLKVTYKQNDFLIVLLVST